MIIFVVVILGKMVGANLSIPKVSGELTWVSIRLAPIDFLVRYKPLNVRILMKQT